MHETWNRYIKLIINDPSNLFTLEEAKEASSLQIYLKNSALNGQLCTQALFTTSEALLSDQRVFLSSKKLKELFWQNYFFSTLVMMLFYMIMIYSNSISISFYHSSLNTLVLIASFFNHFKIIEATPSNWLLKSHLTQKGKLWLNNVFDTKVKHVNKNFYLNKYKEESKKNIFKCETELFDYRQKFQIYHFFTMGATTLIVITEPIWQIFKHLVK